MDRMKINSPLTDLSRVLSSMQSSLRPHASPKSLAAAAEVANSPGSRSRRRSCVSCIDVVFNSNRFDRGAAFRMYGVAFG